jgi:hypothetical protein
MCNKNKTKPYIVLRKGNKLKTEVTKMKGIMMITYAEAKDMCRYVSIDGDNFDIADDVYGVLINNKFIPILMEGVNDYLHA